MSTNNNSQESKIKVSQDMRPVYMGTFDKFIKSNTLKHSGHTNDIKVLVNNVNTINNNIAAANKTIKFCILAIIGSTIISSIAILMHFI